jgi:hypothetical protein
MRNGRPLGDGRARLGSVPVIAPRRARGGLRRSERRGQYLGRASLRGAISLPSPPPVRRTVGPPDHQIARSPGGRAISLASAFGRNSWESRPVWPGQEILGDYQAFSGGSREFWLHPRSGDGGAARVFVSSWGARRRVGWLLSDRAVPVACPGGGGAVGPSPSVGPARPEAVLARCCGIRPGRSHPNPRRWGDVG